MVDADLAVKPLSAATKAALVEQYHRFLHKAASHAYRTIAGRQFGTHNDWYQEAVVALFEAAEKFDTSRGIKFITFATTWVTTRLMTTARRNATIILAPSDDRLCPRSTILAHVARRVRQMHATCDVEKRLREPLAAIVESWDLDDAMRCLPAREYYIISQRFGFDGKRMSHKELAARLKLCKTNVRKIERHAIRKMRAALMKGPPS